MLKLLSTQQQAANKRQEEYQAASKDERKKLERKHILEREKSEARISRFSKTQ